jgi:hypothetical protein
MLSACGNTEPTAAEATTSAEAATVAVATTVAATTTAAASTTAVTTAETAEKENTSIDVSAEVFYLANTEFSTIEAIQLSSWDDFTPGMAETNDAIYNDVYSRIENFEEKDDLPEGYGILVYAYSFTDENYIQIYHTVLEYPTYGTAGDLFGYVYDIANDDYITLDEFLTSNYVTAEEITEEIVTLYSEDKPTDSIGGVYLKTFNLSMDPQGNYSPSILFEMEVTASEAGDPYKGFYVYSPVDDDVWELNSEQLFDPSSVDEYDPPLHCQEGWYDYYFTDAKPNP